MRKVSRLLLCFLFLFTAESAFAEMPKKVLKVSEVRAGTEAIGFSVFDGIEPKYFNVILGEPTYEQGSYFILAEISGGPMKTPLEKIGAIAGMSGSPIFIDCINKELSEKEQHEYCVSTGTLVGALSYSIGYFIEGGMNCLLTPAEYMLGARVGGYEAAAQFSNHMPDKISVGSREFTNLMLFPKMDDLSAQVGSSGKCSDSTEAKLKPGSMVTVFLAKGLIPVGGSGTVTWRDDDKIYIFGHPFFGTGIVNYPFIHVAVATTIQTPVQAYKIPGCYLNTEGAMLVDGAYEMAGVIGRTAPSVPFKVELRLNNGGAVLNEEVIPSPMARLLINQLPIKWAAQLLGDMSYLSLAYQARIVIKDEPEIFLKGIIPTARGEKDSLEELFGRVNLVFENLEKSGFNYGVESIRVRVDFINNLKIWKNKTSFLSQNKAIPGEIVYANIVLEDISTGDTKQISIPVTVPKDFMGRVDPGMPAIISVLVQGGSKFTDKSNTSRMASMETVIKNINQFMNLQPNILYVQQIMPMTKTNQDTNEANAKSVVKPAWNWTDLVEGDFRRLPKEENKEVVLSITPVLDHFIDFNSIFNIMVQEKRDENPDAKNKTKTKKKKWFWIF